LPGTRSSEACSAAFAPRRKGRTGPTRGPSGSGALLRGRFDALEERPARLAGEVEGTRGHERLDHLLVDPAAVGARAEVEQPGEGLAACGEDGFDGVLADALMAPSPKRISCVPGFFGLGATPNARSDSFTSGCSTVMPSARASAM